MGGGCRRERRRQREARGRIESGRRRRRQRGLNESFRRSIERCVDRKERGEGDRGGRWGPVHREAEAERRNKGRKMDGAQGRVAPREAQTQGTRPENVRHRLAKENDVNRREHRERLMAAKRMRLQGVAHGPTGTGRNVGIRESDADRRFLTGARSAPPNDRGEHAPCRVTAAHTAALHLSEAEVVELRRALEV